MVVLNGLLYLGLHLPVRRRRSVGLPENGWGERARNREPVMTSLLRAAVVLLMDRCFLDCGAR